MSHCVVREPDAEEVCGLGVYTTLTVDYTFDAGAEGQSFSYKIPMCEPHYLAMTGSLDAFSAYSVGRNIV